MQFLVEDLVFEDDIKTLISVLKNKKIPYKVFNKGAVNSSYAHLDTCTEKTFCYGSLEFIRKIKELNNPNLITSCTIENYDWRIYYQKYRGFPNNLFNWNFSIIKCRDLEDKCFFHPNNNLFVRPAVGYKPNGFCGGVYTPKDLDYINSCFGRNDELVVAPVKHIDFEYRLIFNKDKYITGCQYKTFCEKTNYLGFDPDKYVPEVIVYLAERMIKSSYWYPDDLFVVDIAKNKEGTFLLEINALSTSGWYDCNYSLIIDEIKETYD